MLLLTVSEWAPPSSVTLIYQGSFTEEGRNKHTTASLMMRRADSRGGFSGASYSLPPCILETAAHLLRAIVHQ